MRSCSLRTTFSGRPSFDTAANTMGLHTSWAKTKIRNVASGPEGPEATFRIFLCHIRTSSRSCQWCWLIGYCTPEILRRIGLASSIMSQLDHVWRQSRLSNTTKFRIYNSCVLSTPIITAICFWSMDTIESWYSKTGLSYDEPKANTRHPLVWICHEQGSRHPLTAGAVHKWSYKSEETFSIWPLQAYGSGCFCPPSSTSLCYVTTAGSGQFGTWRRQLGRSRKYWVKQVTTSTGISLSDLWSVATDRSAWRALPPVDGQA